MTPQDSVFDKGTLDTRRGDLMSVRVGLIHSVAGTMAISERSLLEAELIAIDEINKNGRKFRYRLEPFITEGASDPEIHLSLMIQERMAPGKRK